jgi:hypothetical protein
MTMRYLPALALAAAVVVASFAKAAPLPPFAPVDICGTIVERLWVPSEFRHGQPGFSGSLGHDRVIPAHLRVVLADYAGVDAAVARRINTLLGYTPPSDAHQRVLLRLPTDDPNLLAGVRRVCVEGFAIRGDEGGTWTSYRRAVPGG